MIRGERTPRAVLRVPAGANGERPFSIVRRMMALVAGVSLVSVGLYAFAVMVVLQPFSLDLIERLVGQIGTMERALLAVPPAGRDAFAAALQTDRVSLARSPPIESLVEREDPERIPARLLSGLEKGLHRPVRVIVGPEVDGVFAISFNLPVEGHTWWLTLTGVRPALGMALVPIFGSVVLIGLAAGLTLLVGVRHITQPMSNLAEALLARGGQLTPLDEPPRSSIELQGVVRSFNAMVAAVAAADRSRHDLLAGASHDLRTPLARLRLRAEIEGPPELADKMEVDFIAMSRIIDQFLAYAQGQGDREDAPRYPLVEVVEALVGRYQDEGVDVTFAGSHDHGAAFPETAVQRALGNLIDNARTHGAEPIEVGLVSTSAEIGVMVFDAGHGIPSEAFGEAQKPFVRLEPRAASNGHCGLGLAIVAQVVEGLGGRTVLHPYDGRRSGVGIWLPLNGAVGTAAAKAPEDAPARTTA